MELHQLRYFLAVVDEGSFSAAAQAVRISQSGVSTQIQKLERELGVSLIDRSPRRVTLTPAGRALLPAIRSVLTAVAQVSATAHDLRGLVVGSLRIGTVTGLAWPRLVDALAALHTRHPGVDLRLHEGNSDDLVAGVRDGRLDIAVAGWAGEPPPGLPSRIVIDDALVAIVAPGHRWADRAAVDPGSWASSTSSPCPPAPAPGPPWMPCWPAPALRRTHAGRCRRRPPCGCWPPAIWGSACSARRPAPAGTTWWPCRSTTRWPGPGSAFSGRRGPAEPPAPFCSSSIRTYDGGPFRSLKSAPSMAPVRRQAPSAMNQSGTTVHPEGTVTVPPR